MRWPLWAAWASQAAGGERRERPRAQGGAGTQYQLKSDRQLNSGGLRLVSQHTRHCGVSEIWGQGYGSLLCDIPHEQPRHQRHVSGNNCLKLAHPPILMRDILPALLGAAAVALLCPHAAHATVSLPAIFGDGMVLQTNNDGGFRPVVYGAAAPGEQVVVNVSAFGSAGVFITTADNVTGGWSVTLLPASTAPDQNAPFNVTVAGSSDNYARVITFSDVVFGDVFLCGGQSNMVFNVDAAFNGSTYSAQTWPLLR
jgi:hypothetical protein